MLTFRIVFALALLSTLSFALRSDEGVGIDPFGNNLDHRCTIDPNGGPCQASTATLDRGAGLDPDGA